MLEIAANEINSFNGLSGDGDKANVNPNAQYQPGSGTSDSGTSGNGNGWQTAQNVADLVNQGADIFVKVNDSLNNNSSNNNNNGGYYASGINTRNVSGNSNNNNKETDYLPWILGGLGVIMLFGIMTMSKKN